MIKAGLQLFPGRCYMLILYSNYLIDVLDNSQTGYSQMAAAKQVRARCRVRVLVMHVVMCPVSEMKWVGTRPNTLILLYTPCHILNTVCSGTTP